MKKLSCLKLFLTFILISSGTCILQSQTSTASIFGNNMVLQQSTDANIWGWDKPGQKIKVRTSWNNNEYASSSDMDGKWIIKIKTPSAGGPYKITVRGSSTLILKNVLIGEVWLCSGQSNMEMPMKGFSNQPVLNSQEAILNSENDNLRLFNVERSYSRTPQADCEGEWKISNPENCREFSAVAYLFGDKLNSVLDIPIGLIQSSWGGTDVLTWTDSITVASYKQVSLNDYIGKKHNYPAALFNGMINPVVPYTINGVIWYQGEYNRSQPELYDYAFPGMIENWRDLFEKDDLSFLYVQIAPYKYDGRHMGAYLRESQLKTMLNVANTGMAVTMDIGDYNYIHPTEKQKVGDRLAYWALAKTYRIKGIDFSGPAYREMEIKGHEAHLYFDYAEEGLTSFGKKLKYFQVAGDDKVFYPAEAKISGKGRIIVTCDEVEEPVAVRYAWFDYAKGNLFNTAGLPASSFRTDSWK